MDIEKANQILSWFSEKQTKYNPLFFLWFLNPIKQAFSVIIDSKGDRYKQETTTSIKLKAYIANKKKTDPSFVDLIQNFIKTNNQAVKYFYYLKDDSPLSKKIKTIKSYSENIEQIRDSDSCFKQEIETNRKNIKNMLNDLDNISDECDSSLCAYEGCGNGYCNKTGYSPQECLEKLDNIAIRSDIIITTQLVKEFYETVCEKEPCFKSN